MTRKTVIPQADSLPKLRLILERAAAGASTREAGEAAGLKPRHIGYYASAAEALRLAVRRGETLQILVLGRQLLDSPALSRAEASVWRRAIEDSDAVTSVAPTLLGLAGPTKDQLSARIAKAGPHKRTTADRRAESLLRWRKHVLELEHQTSLAFFGDAKWPLMRYSGPAVLRSLRIKSFKGFGEPAGAKPSPAAIAFRPLTVLVGPNGAGKSTILQAIDVLAWLVRGNIAQMLKAHEWDYDDLPHLRSGTQKMTIAAEVELDRTLVSWSMTLGTRKHPGIEAESVTARSLDQPDSLECSLLERTGRHVTVTHETTGERASLPLLTYPQSWLGTLDPSDAKDKKLFPGLLALRKWAEGVHAFWSLDPSTLRSPSRGAREGVGSRGEDLASLLFRLKKRQPKKFAAFVKRVIRHYPRLVAIDPRSAEYGWKYLAITERWNGETATFNARQVSDGLLRLIAVASLPEWDTPPSIILLDEIENGLHPRLIGGVAELLTEVSKTTQVITTTHSPITLNYVSPACTSVVTRGRNGAVVVTPFVETKNYTKLREHFDPGELWYNAGEERLVGRAR